MIRFFLPLKNIRGTPQCFHNMLLDVLAKIRQFAAYTFFLTFSAAEFHWAKIIQVVACQYGQELTEDSEVVEFIDKSIICVLPDETKYPEISNLLKKVQTHHHTTTCRKKKV